MSGHVSASKGKIVITGIPGVGQGGTAGDKELCIGTYTMDRTNKLADITSSCTNGWETFAVVTQGATVNAEVKWDSTATPEDCRLVDGIEITANLHVGNSEKMYEGVKLLIESLPLVGCSQDNVVTYSFTAKVNEKPPALSDV